MREPIPNIRVGVIHGPGNMIKPVWFDLNRRKHTIREITNQWSEPQGASSALHFHVVDDGALYELIYELGSGCWQLAQIEAL